MVICKDQTIEETEGQIQKKKRRNNIGQAATPWQSTFDEFNQDGYFLHATNSFADPGPSSSAVCIWKKHVLQCLIPYCLHLTGQEITSKTKEI